MVPFLFSHVSRSFLAVAGGPDWKTDHAPSPPAQAPRGDERASREHGPNLLAVRPGRRKRRQRMGRACARGNTGAELAPTVHSLRLTLERRHRIFYHEACEQSRQNDLTVARDLNVFTHFRDLRRTTSRIIAAQI
jgi:hypothetical protein